MVSKISIGLKDPKSAINYILKGKDYIIKKKISDLTKKPLSEVDKYYDQIKTSDFISDKLMKMNLGQILKPEWIYTICRIIKPDTVVETGVSSGMSSSYILKALSDNGKGKLVSIDMPQQASNLKQSLEYVPFSKNIPKQVQQSGWIVPDYLKERWTLKLGLVQNLLIPTLDELEKIDIFFHDSEHTYQNMLFEFRNAWKYLRKDGLLLSHDINWNHSFDDFSKEVNRKYTHIYFTSAGGLIK